MSSGIDETVRKIADFIDDLRAEDLAKIEHLEWRYRALAETVLDYLDVSVSHIQRLRRLAEEAVAEVGRR